MDTEFELMSTEELAAARQVYVVAEGDGPIEREEVTDSQLSCLRGKLATGAPPFVDMGVWGPYGERLARAMKFVSQEIKDGKWHIVELPGAASLDAWEEAWRIFRTAAIMLNVATAAVLDRYGSEFKMRVQENPHAWHLAARADIRCRTEFWPQERRRQEAFFGSHATMSVFNPLQPWNSVIRASSSAAEYWSRELEKPALRYSLHGPKAMMSRPKVIEEAKGFDVSGRSHQASGVKRDGRGAAKDEPRRRDGRYLKSRAGIEICYEWGRSREGCSNDGQCPQRRAHVCEWCRQPHRAVDCPQVPGWAPGTEPAGRGKGRGRAGRGRGARGQRRHM
jgi:hypothetical protein